MKISEALRKYPKLETELLLSHVLKKSKEFLYLHPETKLTTVQSKKLSAMIKRRKKGEPIAYILGYKDFYGLRFKVTEYTLVPRPETELVVDKALALIKKHKLRSVLDLGTGTGCIAISIAKNSKAKTTGSDVSKKALAVARHNGKAHSVNIKFVISDLLDQFDHAFDVIVANLPYGWADWKNNSSADTQGLKFEPKTALFTEEKGLFQIRRLLEQVSDMNNKPRFILLEFDPRQRLSLSQLIKKTLPGSKAKFYKDLAKHWRAVEIIV